MSIPEPECHVYTLGTDSWRRVELGEALFELPSHTSCVFFNGNLHWVVTDADSRLGISCFVLETECFSSFSTPLVDEGSVELISGLSVLKGCLCLCCLCFRDHSFEDETAIWLMMEYGMKESWTKEYVLYLNQDDICIEGFELSYPIKGFEDGDILMQREDSQLFYYSSRSETGQETYLFGEGFVISTLLTPSFLSLKSLGMESVSRY